MPRVIATRLSLDGEKEFKKQMGEVNSALKTMKDELSYTEAAFRGQANSMEALTEKDRILRKEIEQQAEKVRALEKAVEDASEAFGDSDKRTDAYRQSLFRAKKELIGMEDELKDTDKYLDEARQSADKCAKSIDEFGREAKQADNELDGLGEGFEGAGGGIDGLLQGLSKLKGVAVAGAVAGVAVEVGKAVLELEESTREYRQLMGQLEVSSRDAGYTAEQTSEIYMKLYGVIGEAQATVEATTQLQALKLSQEELITVTDAVVGAWTRLGGAAPIESIAEAVMQTINAGSATGAFSDILVAAGRSEDEFNAKMEACSTAAERQNVVMQELASMGLVDAAQGYYELNADVIAANESQARMEAAMGHLGEACAPLANALRNLGATGVEFLADTIDATIAKVRSLRNQLKELEQDTKYANYSQYAVQDIDVSKIHGSHAAGLDFVPFDGYRAELHYGERVMTATENAALETLDRAVAALGGGRVSGPDTTVRVTVPVMLNGRTVGEAVTSFQLNEGRANG